MTVTTMGITWNASLTLRLLRLSGAAVARGSTVAASTAIMARRCVSQSRRPVPSEDSYCRIATAAGRCVAIFNIRTLLLSIAMHPLARAGSYRKSQADILGR